MTKANPNRTGRIPILESVRQPRARSGWTHETRADDSTRFAPPLTLGLQRIGRDSSKSAALID
jgi:hypothetical protein